MDLRSTLNLPDAEFTIPMKADLAKREPEMQATWEQQRLYHRIQELRKDAPGFVLHDGPPYTNGPIHIGTSLNKILKDFVVKSRTMMGFRAPYVPGFDNHGLPIEQSVMKDLHGRGMNPDLVTLRKACRAHAAKYVDIQTEQFKRLGVFGLWENPYTTMGYRYEAEIIRVFGRLAAAGFVYRGLRPTLWSPTSQTALADTEIVYQDHTSKAIFVRFPLRHDSTGWAHGLEGVYTVIWTTTPWTIPANLAVAFHPAMEYAVVRTQDARYVVHAGLVEKLAAELGWSSVQVERVVLGASFDGSTFKHPIYDRDSLAVLANYVSADEGTGVVHTAPGHGRDDFETGMKYGLPILCPVDERGVLTDEAGEFAGTKYKDCDVVVVERLRELGNLLKAYDHVHSYPFAERDAKPVIFRATEQWFLGIDTADLRTQMLQQIENVEWLPASGKARIQGMVANRPDWCISRQRPWGVGIPVLYGVPSGEPVLAGEAIEAVASLVEQQGSDAWFERDPSEFLPAGFAHPSTGETEFRKETDVLDVWFDSGCTSLCVLEGNVDPAWKDRWPADLYLEGSDQHRGWFNSSLVISTAIHGQAPYRAVLTHGFVTDEKGHKMSKRLGNVVDPVEAASKFGADVIRYWVASVDWANDVPCSDDLLRQFGENYRTIRNTLRFLLGNLFDYSPMPQPSLLEIDEWLVERTDLLAYECGRAYATYDFGDVVSSIHNFCVNELSKFYADALKDRMYCDGRDWPSRRSGQYACHYALDALTRLIAPILPHTAEEVFLRTPEGAGGSAGIHAEHFRTPTDDRIASIRGNDLQTRMQALLEIRSWVFAEFETGRATATTKDSQDVIVQIQAESQVVRLLKSFGLELPNLLKVSWVELLEGSRHLAFAVSTFLKCERSRLRRPDVELWNGVPLSKRDRKVLDELGVLN